ncbi:HlyD family efflux transporter periplasmic adaptor subunit [Novosphingobium sp.]|uniref:HlyD family secretion protein n=1 Tax=Novosphingobium sp. TaxID=1874826 RepID=UPI0025DB0E77|nr:HlyD family efflux transporter periplasmic adaptor subunit [Novosphingobium sp.]MCC6925353.1 HlyD family efflux transporter periplasmic adaptor subunit [Novosphingobium sp.]
MSGLPKPLIAVVVLALAGGAGWYLTRSEEQAQWLGYVEAETAYVAAPVSGRLAQRMVDRGASVAAGAVLFSLDPETTDADTARIEAQVSAAQAQQADLAQARQRAPELAAARAAEAAAQAQLTKAQADFNRIDALARRGFASRSQLDTARAARDSASASLAQTRAQVASGELTAGRQGQIAAAGAEVAANQAALRAQRQRRREIAPIAPEAGVVEQTFYNPGEWVPANAPVVSVLPDGRRKLRFYVPQDRIATLKPGMNVTFSCDGCGDPRQARISYISPRAEFTPPVIYSERARAKLVFLVEAALPAGDKPLPPGLPVEVKPQ